MARNAFFDLKVLIPIFMDQVVKFILDLDSLIFMKEYMQMQHCNTGKILPISTLLR